MATEERTVRPQPSRLLTPTQRRRANYAVSGTITALVALALWRLVDWGEFGDAFFDWDIFVDQFPRILTVAAKNTVIYTVLGFGGGLALGLLLAVMRLSSFFPFRWVSLGFIELFRGIPALFTIILIGFGLPIAFGTNIPGVYGPGALALAIVTAAYMAETIRAGIEGVPKGQMEAARSLGMSRPKAMVLVIIPQAFRLMIPPLTNELVLLLKDTSLLFVLGTQADGRELMQFGRRGLSDTFNLTPLTAVALVYLMITIPLSMAARRLERRASEAK